MVRWLGLIVLVGLIVVAVNLMSSSEKKEDEKQFQATVASYRDALKPGTSRAQVEDYFQKQNISFDKQPSSDRTKLGEQPRNLFCQPWKVYLDFQFKSSGMGAAAARDSDVLTGMELKREGVCF